MGPNMRETSLAGYSPWGHRVRYNWVTGQQQHIMKNKSMTYRYMYGWVPSLFTWNYHNIVIKKKQQQQPMPWAGVGLLSSEKWQWKLIWRYTSPPQTPNTIFLPLSITWAPFLWKEPTQKEDPPRTMISASISLSVQSRYHGGAGRRTLKG